MSMDAARDRAVRRVLIVEMLLNLLVAAAKGIYGLWSGSLAIASDALHSVVDAGANIVALTLLRLSAAPPDEGHPYGHRRVEILAATALGVVIGVVAVRFGWSAIEALRSGAAPPTTSVAGFVVITGTLIVNIFVASYEARKGRELNSAFLTADAKHTATDVLVTLSVLASYAAAYFGVSWADPVGALLVVGVIGVVAWRIISSNVSILMDAAALDAERIHGIAMSVPDVVGCHKVRSRGAAGAVQVDMHLMVDAGMSLRAAHDVAHTVEDAIRAAVPEVRDVTIHVEPHDDAHEGLD